MASTTQQSQTTSPSQRVVSEKDLVRNVLLYANNLVDIFVFGIGGRTGFENPLKPTLHNPTAYQDAIRAVLEAARTCTLGPADEEAAPEHNCKPLLAVLSTMGISEIRSLPFPMMPMYKWILKVSYIDKMAMKDFNFPGNVA